MSVKPRYPVYIPSKGRSADPLTARAFVRDAVDFRIVVEPAEVPAYSREFGGRLIVLPENNRGLVYARNFIKAHAIKEGHVRHWQFDDDIRHISRVYRGWRLRCPAGVALAAAEDFVERYENVGLASLNSEFFVPCTGTVKSKFPPFVLNGRCYTCFLMLNSLPFVWRHRYNEDTDMTLQVLAGGWCTVLFNAFLIKTLATMTASGGQESVYSAKIDGRLKMARQLERVWPGVVTTKRRFGRPQHHVNGHWRKFDTQLKLRPGVDLSKLKPNEYGMELAAVAEVKSGRLRTLLRKAGG